MEVRGERCGECGTALDEWDPKKGGDINAYYAEPYICPGCKSLQDALVAAKDQHNPSGVKVRFKSQSQKRSEFVHDHFFGDPRNRL